MPTAADPTLVGQLPQTHNPLSRINYNPFTSVFDPVKQLQAAIDWLETYGLQALHEVTGIDFSFLKPVIDNLKAFLGGTDITSVAFDPAAAAITFFNAVLHPTGVAVGTTDITGAGTGGSFPYTFPITLPAEPTPAGVFFNNLKNFLNFDYLQTGMDLAAAYTAFINGGLLPQNILASLNDLGLVVQNLVNAFNNVPFVGGILGGALEAAWNVVRGLFVQGLQNTNDIIVLRTAVEAPSGAMTFTQTFDGAFSSTFPAGWTQTITGSGSGQHWGLGGDGNAFWDVTGGSGFQQIVSTYNTSATTVKQYAAVVLNNWITDATPPEEYLLIRSDTSGANCVWVRINPHFIRLEAVVAGVPTQLGSQWNQDWQSGDTIEIYGNDTNARRYIVKRNGVTIIDDSSDTVSNTALRKIGVAGRNGLSFFGLPVPISRMKSVAGRDA